MTEIKAIFASELKKGMVLENGNIIKDVITPNHPRDKEQVIIYYKSGHHFYCDKNEIFKVKILTKT